MHESADSLLPGPIRFPSKVPVELPDWMIENATTVHRRQAADGDRFAAALGDLTSRMNLDGGAIVGITADHRFAQLVENWVVGCDRSGIEVRSRTLAFATDHDAAARLDEQGSSSTTTKTPRRWRR